MIAVVSCKLERAAPNGKTFDIEPCVQRDSVVGHYCGSNSVQPGYPMGYMGRSVSVSVFRGRACLHVHQDWG